METESMANRASLRVVLSALFGLALLCTVLAVLVMPMDVAWSDWLRNWDLPGDLAKAITLSEAFAHGFGALFVLGSILWIARDRRKQILVAILITAASGLAANGMKSLFVRVRPHAADELVVKEDAERGATMLSTGGDARQAVASSFWDARQRSFPSGHTATAWGLAIGLSLVFPRGIPVFGILATLASLQRLTSGAHYPSDVFAGAAIAFALSAMLLCIPPLSRAAEISQRVVTE